MKLNQQIVSNGIISLMALNNKDISVSIKTEEIQYCFFLQENTVRIEIVEAKGIANFLHCVHYPIIDGECIWDSKQERIVI